MYTAAGAERTVYDLEKLQSRLCRDFSHGSLSVLARRKGVTHVAGMDPLWMVARGGPIRDANQSNRAWKNSVSIERGEGFTCGTRGFSIRCSTD
jgi:hypothetical protein